MRRACKPKGPIGYLLESVHLQGAAMDKNFVVQQWNQPAIEILNVPYQHSANLIRQMCTRNRTRCEEGCRKETVELHEIDRAATKAETKKTRRARNGHPKYLEDRFGLDEDRILLGRKVGR